MKSILFWSQTTSNACDANMNRAISPLEPIPILIEIDQSEKKRRVCCNVKNGQPTFVIVPLEFARARPVGAREETTLLPAELGRLLLRGRPAERRALDTWCSTCEVWCRRCKDASTRRQIHPMPNASLEQERNLAV